MRGGAEKEATFRNCPKLKCLERARSRRVRAGLDAMKGLSERSQRGYARRESSVQPQTHS
jgi:hypothetical protein